jgi:uncharacterized protein YgiM (DUF1202 family)
MMAAKVTPTRLVLLALSSATLGTIAGAVPGIANAAASAEERFTPTPPPSVALPRLTPLGAPLGNVALKPYPAAPPQVAPALSPVRTPGAPPKAPSVKPTASAAEPSAPRVEAAPLSDSAPAPVEPPQSETAKAPAPSPTKPRDVVTTAGVYLRATPSGKGRVIDALDRGQRLEMIGATSDGWAQVGRKGKSIGYVSADYLTDAPPTKPPANGDTSAPAAKIPSSYAKATRGNRGCALPDDLPPSKQRTTLPVGARARVTADANLRVAPVCDAKVLDVLDAGERVTIQGVSGSWYRVARRNRMIGYVGAALLAAKPER